MDRHIFPSINIGMSGTRKGELLYHPDELSRIVLLRRALTGVPPVEAMELLLGNGGSQSSLLRPVVRQALEADRCRFLMGKSSI